MPDMETLTKMILQDYAQGRDIDKTAFPGCPDPEAAAVLTDNLYRIVFPGRTAGRDVRGLIAGTAALLENMLPERMGRGAESFLQRIPAIRAVVQADLRAAFEGDPAATGAEELILAYPGLYAVTVYRLAHELYALGAPILPRMMTEHAHSATGIDIHPGAVIGERFFIDHGTGTVIGQTAVIGRDVKLYQGVTLGGLSTRGGQSLRNTRRHPTLEDHVTVYANATILGGDTVIGKYSVIGAGSFITASVPPCTTVTIRNQELVMRPRSCEECKKIPPL